jgi:hypothetical protein
VQCCVESVHSVTARQRSDKGMPASLRRGAAASAHVVHGARTDPLMTDTTCASSWCSVTVK